MRAGSSWESGWPMATSKQLQFLANEATASAVREGLSATPKWLPAKLFYDEAGSALFEQITELPEYYLTRTERAIFESYAGEILQAAGPSLTLVELGAGTATKTCILIEELLQRQPRALFYPIDVSPSALQEAATQLGRQFPQLRVNPIVADYTGGVEALNRISGRKLVLYIGSSIGNFEPDESVRILRRIRRTLAGGRCAAAGRGLCQEPEDTHSGLRRRAGRHGGLQQEHSGAAQSRTGRRLRSRRVPPRRAVEPALLAHGDAPGEHGSAAGIHPDARHGHRLSRRASASTPRTATSTPCEMIEIDPAGERLQAGAELA